MFVIKIRNNPEYFVKIKPLPVTLNGISAEVTALNSLVYSLPGIIWGLFGFYLTRLLDCWLVCFTEVGHTMHIALHLALFASHHVDTAVHTVTSLLY